MVERGTSPERAGLPGRLMTAVRQLYVQVLVAIVLAIVVGLAWPGFGANLKPLGDAFISILKVLIGPIIFFTVVQGLAQISNLSKLGRVVLKAFVYFEVVSTLALLIGLVVGNVLEPGAGLHASGEVTDQIAGYEQAAEESGGIVHFLQDLIPDTFFSAFTEGEILQILILSLVFGVAALLLNEKVPTVMRLVAEGQQVFFKMLGFVMRLAPFGAFGAMCYTVSTYGSATLLSLFEFVLMVYATALVFVLVVLGGICALCGLSIFKVLRLIRDELVLVLGTSSSEVALPRLLAKLERAGCEKSVVGLVIPAGYSFNMDGTAIYMSMSVLFISHATDTPLSLGQQLGVLVVLLFTSKGGAGVSGLGFVKLSATLQSVKVLPIGGLGVLIGVDRFMSEVRSLTNLVGNTVATLAIAKWEKSFDAAKFHAYYANPVLDDPEPEEVSAAKV
ncbi:dicarboxylate/amino acid:cation symporter [Amycolatopsis endophytica]|uniref:Aerobic C4-dicarboxylate transport protein n=1 Tax=Amycolatopsis endophytica TaxID=860233 RepID=A0A853BF70_9PSEU|nr:C4-dicarboxylate transporter DctA [Amycolatopsis endophytica]NYI93136.1 aerobic C4-dicarboxylate transport protein [Amycolatopsis endophytica]